jgi:hypothetical protein
VHFLISPRSFSISSERIFIETNDTRFTESFYDDLEVTVANRKDEQAGEFRRGNIQSYSP